MNFSLCRQALMDPEFRKNRGTVQSSIRGERGSTTIVVQAGELGQIPMRHLVMKILFTSQLAKMCSFFLYLGCFEQKENETSFLFSLSEPIRKGGRILVDIKGEFSWTKGVNSRGHFPCLLVDTFVHQNSFIWVNSRGHFLGEFSWTFWANSRGQCLGEFSWTFLSTRIREKCPLEFIYFQDNGCILVDTFQVSIHIRDVEDWQAKDRIAYISGKQKIGRQMTDQHLYQGSRRFFLHFSAFLQI